MDEILWGYTPDECEPYIKYMQREIIFRESVIGMRIALCGPTDEEKKEFERAHVKRTMTKAKKLKKRMERMKLGTGR